MSAIAIVGIGCRFAGAPDLHAYWNLMLEGRDSFGPVPPDRWPAEVFFDTNRRAVDKSYAPAGGFIDDIQSFPALAFGLPPRRVEVMDPQQRFAIEVALQAIEDAGYHPAELPERTGVFLGVTATEYRVLQSARVIAQLMASGFTGTAPQHAEEMADAVDRVVPSRPYTAPGTLGNMAAAAVAQELDLHGPAYTTDAACASAHMALSDAIALLRTGQLDAALAGGVYVCVTPEHHIAFSRIGAMSAQGRCLPFDARADGFVQGDGAGLVLLKRLEDAERDGDRIYAVIEGVAINNDGRGDGPMAPSIPGQTEVIRAAWRDAGLDRASLGYMEAHGTGTDVGDLTELKGLQAAFGDAVHAVPLGSAKANVGHTMSAAGVAGLIRAAMAIHHATVPPMAGFETAREELGVVASGFFVPTAPAPWASEQRVAGVSSFGFGGTNGHIVLRQAPVARPASEAQAELVRLTAYDEPSLRDLAARTAEAIAADPTATVAGVARAWAHRPEQVARLAVVATTVDELIDALRAVGRGEDPKEVRIGVAAEEAPKIAALFPGQGSQRLGMMAGIRDRFPVVAETLDAFEAELAGQLPVPLTHLLYPERRAIPVDDDTALAELTDTASCQPALLACAVALDALLRQVGVRPAVVTGHSLGEFTAAAVAGVLDPADAARFVARRGRAMADLTGDPGAMAAINAEREVALGLLVEGAVIANLNHPRQVVVSGATSAIEQVVARAEAAGVKAQRLVVSHGFHGPTLAGLDAAPLLDGIAFHDPAIPVASGIAAHPYAGADDARGVFLRHATSPVDFVRALEQCRAAGAEVYLQVGAGGPLASFARGSLPEGHKGVFTLASLDDADGGRSLLLTLGQLWVLGVPLDLSAVTAPAALASVPPRLLPRERYWALKDTTQLRLEVRQADPTARPQQVATNEPAPPPVGAGDSERVLAVIAKVSAYPRDALKPAMALVDDLGFDSLMVGDLATGLADAFPGLPGIPQELLINGPTVQDIVDYVLNAGDEDAVEHDDDEPLRAWEPTWADAPAPALPERPLSPLVVGVVGDSTGTARSVIPALQAAGHTVKVLATPADAADVAWLVVCDRDPRPDVGDALSDGGWVDAAGPFLAWAAAARRKPHLTAVLRDGDPWAAAIAGAVRSLAAEWPESRCRAIYVDDAAHVGQVVLAEATCADVTPVIRVADGGRQVEALSPVDVQGELALGADDTVLITGGTRGIGASLAEALVARGCRVLLVGRGDPSGPASDLLAAHPDRARHVRADVTDRAALETGVAGETVTAVVHCAGVLADGAVEEVDPEHARLARAVKAAGWLAAVHAAGPSLKVALGVGSWAGRFGNRHQTHYAAANALLAELSRHVPAGVRAAVAELGPWTSSEMAATIPAPVKAAMRAEGVDFVGDEAGLQALLADLAAGSGPLVRGRRLTPSLRVTRVDDVLSTATHPYLLDHAIEGVPVLPLAGAADLVAYAAALPAPFEVTDLTLFQGVPVREATPIRVTVRGERAEIRAGSRGALAYRATVRSVSEVPADPGVLPVGAPPTLDLRTFYDTVTFHGPMLQGLVKIDHVGDSGARAHIRSGSPRAWIPASPRAAFAIDPLVLDSAMQLAAYAAWLRFGRAGTPVGLGRYVQLAPLPEGQVVAEVRFGEAQGDRFVLDQLTLRDTHGTLLALAEGIVAELRKVEGSSEAPAPLVIDPQWIDPSLWPEVKALEQRLDMAKFAGIENPYFAVHDGIARDTTSVAGRELVNFSSYNYLGLSGDPRVVADVAAAAAKYGTSVSASRVASGERPFHRDLEKELAAAHGCEDAVVFTAGHATNVTTIGHLLGAEDLILHDELIHDSILQGVKLSGAARRSFRHDDPRHLEEQLQTLRSGFRRTLIVVEGVYSMDGDICDLPAYVELKTRFGCLLMVDEAHSFGIVGGHGLGVREHFGIAPGVVDLFMGTLSKSLASCGGWIAGSRAVVNYLRYTAPGFVYSAGITPPNGQAALSSLRLMLAEPWRVAKLQDNARFFQDELVARGLNTGPARGESGVVPVITGNSFHALMLSQRLRVAGVNVQPIVYPAVADDAARLRFFLSSTHSHEQLAWTAEQVATILDGVRKEFAA